MSDDRHRGWADSWSIMFAEDVLKQMNDRLTETDMYIKFDAGELLDPTKYAIFKGDANKHIVRSRIKALLRLHKLRHLSGMMETMTCEITGACNDV